MRGVTPRRLAAAKRALKNQQDKTPLFAEQISEKQPTPEERINGFDSSMAKIQQGSRDKLASQIKQLRNDIRAMSRQDQREITSYWNDVWKGPRSPSYLSGLINRWKAGERPDELKDVQYWLSMQMLNDGGRDLEKVLDTWPTEAIDNIGLAQNARLLRGIFEEEAANALLTKEERQAFRDLPGIEGMKESRKLALERVAADPGVNAFKVYLDDRIEILEADQGKGTLATPDKKELDQAEKEAEEGETLFEQTEAGDQAKLFATPSKFGTKTAKGAGASTEDLLGNFNNLIEADKQGDMFDAPAATQGGDLEAIKEQVIRFASGMSRTGDIDSGTWALGGSNVGGIGVDIGEVSGPGMNELAKQIVERESRVFIDSGAFGIFKRNMKQAESDQLLLEIFEDEIDAAEFKTITKDETKKAN